MLRAFKLCLFALGVLALAVLLAFTAWGPVDDPTLFPQYDASAVEPPPQKPAVAHNPVRNLLWGDLHIHTSYSTDAYTMGVRATPDDAYVFARGGTIAHAVGYPIRIDRPLDFAAVTDHSEYMGVSRADTNASGGLQERSLRERLQNDGPLSMAWALVSIVRNVSGLDLYSNTPESLVISKNAWQLMIDTAEAHNEPGVFTTLLGYEWTSMPDGQNLHRNVIYRDTNAPDIPFSSLDSGNPEDLWDALDRQRNEGKTVMAIPHNGNVSNGLMYDRKQFDGGPLTADYAEQRLRNEPVSEILQIKGTSDTHPMLSPEDEFANFEIMAGLLSPTAEISEPKGSYARDALRAGIEFSHSDGFNPYRFGVIGSSDSHNASSSVEENKHHGKLPLMDGTAGLRLGKSIFVPGSLHRTKNWGAAGLAAVWAQENTRESVYDALERRETFATSGPRISLRFFASFDYTPEMMQSPELLTLAYEQGVPMGGILQAAPLSSPNGPAFAVWVAKDPNGANLDRLQIIKGWINADGSSEEKVFDVALSDQRTANADGSIPPVGNTVDVARATYRNSIGARQLSAFWRDPEFDPALEAFYYARGLEIPTPRWSTYDAMRLGVEAPQPTSLQERAISSAIWYEPK